MTCLCWCLPAIHYILNSCSLAPISDSDVGSEVLKTVIMKGPISWDTMTCVLLRVNRRFGGSYRFHLHSRRISQVRNLCEAGSKQRSVLGLLLFNVFINDLCDAIH
jgi:hypothetical protein